MKIKIDSQIKIENPTKEIKDFCKNNLEITNPEIAKKEKMGFYVAKNIPKKLKMYSKNGNTYVLPIGEINNIWKIHPNNADYEINFGKHEKLDFPKNTLKLYDYQEKAVKEMIKAKRGILSSKCGSGKSIMALEIIRRIGYKALIICEKKEILNQFVDYCTNVFNMKKGDYGTIQAGTVEIGTFITIALRQTLAKIDLLEYKFEWGTIVVDEGQNVGGSVTKCTQYSKILNNLAAQHRFAVSATAYRTDGLTRCMYSLLNTVKYEIPESAIENKVIKANIIKIDTNYEMSDACLTRDGTLNYITMRNEIVLNRERNEFILEFLKQNKEHYCLVLSDRLDNLEMLYKALNEGCFINGSMTTKKAKEEREQAIIKMRNKEEHFLFATYSLAREGLDIKPLDRLFLITPTKNRITLIQSIGRVERQDEGKETPLVYDFVDKDIFYQKAFKSRKTTYRKNGNIIL